MGIEGIKIGNVYEVCLEEKDGLDYIVERPHDIIVVKVIDKASLYLCGLEVIAANNPHNLKRSSWLSYEKLKPAKPLICYIDLKFKTETFFKALTRK